MFPRLLCILSTLSVLSWLNGLCADSAPAPAKTYVLSYDRPAPLDADGWESLSLPLGNGHFGVSFFGGSEHELWQFCDKSLYVMAPKEVTRKPEARVGLSSLCELHLFQNTGPDRTAPLNYRRSLDLDRALGAVSFETSGVTYRRELLTSYPDRCFAARLSASQPGRISFRLQAVHPYLGEFRSGDVQVEGHRLIMRGITQPYRLRYEVQIEVQCRGGVVRGGASGETASLTVEGADEALVVVTLGTNYRLDPQVFLTTGPAAKLAGFPLPSTRIAADLQAALTLGWDKLRERHEADYRALFGRVRLDLGGGASGLTTDVLRARADRSPAETRYLEELYFQFGRYLLIASSRPGTLPANLQGTWNYHQFAPWSGGYWANINLEMNYWPTFVANLEETFEPYYALFRASFPHQQEVAQRTLAVWKPGSTLRGGWTLGTGNTAFSGAGPGKTSGAGTGPFVNQGLWEWYAFTGDPAVLEKIWPFLLEGSRFLAALLEEQPDGTWLCSPSWSPEQRDRQRADHLHVNLPGTAYDQQWVYENYRHTLSAAKLLGRDDPLLSVLSAQLPRLSPVIIGASGQIKEFRQEETYGEIGDPHHRHLSHLVGLFPGRVILEKPEWIAAARVSLNLRGDKSTGWAMAHRLNAWARLRDGDRAHSLLTTLLNEGTLPNLWDTHPPFQIDGNFGGTAGIAEMLLQSHAGAIDLLPALPRAWSGGSFHGLRARGGYTVDCQWQDRQLVAARVTARISGPCTVRHGEQSVVLDFRAGESITLDAALRPVR